MGGGSSASGDCILDAGGESGSSGKSSRKRDMVRFGTPALTRRTGILPGAGSGAGTGAGGGGAGGIESRDVLENDGGPAEFRLFLFPQRNMELHDRRDSLLLLVSCSEFTDVERSVTVSDTWRDLERDNFLRSDDLDRTVVGGTLGTVV